MLMSFQSPGMGAAFDEVMVMGQSAVPISLMAPPSRTLIEPPGGMRRMLQAATVRVAPEMLTESWICQSALAQVVLVVMSPPGCIWTGRGPPVPPSPPPPPPEPLEQPAGAMARTKRRGRVRAKSVPSRRIGNAPGKEGGNVPTMGAVVEARNQSKRPWVSARIRRTGGGGPGRGGLWPRGGRGSGRVPCLSLRGASARVRGLAETGCRTAW